MTMKLLFKWLLLNNLHNLQLVEYFNFKYIVSWLDGYMYLHWTFLQCVKILFMYLNFNEFRVFSDTWYTFHELSREIIALYINDAVSLSRVYLSKQWSNVSRGKRDTQREREIESEGVRMRESEWCVEFVSTKQVNLDSIGLFLKALSLCSHLLLCKYRNAEHSAADE